VVCIRTEQPARRPAHKLDLFLNWHREYRDPRGLVCRPRLCLRTLRLWCPCGTCRRLWSDIVNSALRSGLTATARDTATLSGEPYQDEHDPKRTGVVIYLYVSDADAVRAEWASCGVEGRLGEARSHGLRNARVRFRGYGRHPAPSGFEVALRIRPATAELVWARLKARGMAITDTAAEPSYRALALHQIAALTSAWKPKTKHRRLT